MSPSLLKFARKLIAGVSATALMALPLGSAFAQSATQQVLAQTLPTATPIKHVIFIIGENRSFDNVYATYQPKNGQTIWNLLSRGIINVDGTPGKNFAQGRQFQATTTSGTYFLSPTSKTPYTVLPLPRFDGNTFPVGAGLLPQVEDRLPASDNVVTATGMGTTLFPMGDTELPNVPAIQILEATGGPDQFNPPVSVTGTSPDTRLTNFASLPPGPFQQSAPELPYDSYVGDTTHGMFQMWQQSDCSISHATPDNPTGCIHDLYPFVATTNSTAIGGTPEDGSQDMGFYNMAQGDAPIFKMLADQYTLGDNFHQSTFGPSTPGAIAIAFGDNVFFSDANGNPAVPPTGSVENVNPVAGTINEYQNGGNWVICSDPTQPGVSEITQYLATLPYVATPSCVLNAAYLLDDVNPGFNANGTLAPGNVPPVMQRHIGDVLNAGNIPWIYYGGAYNFAVNSANGSTNLIDLIENANYCAVCNPFQYANSVMSSATQRTAHLRDVVGNGTVNGFFDDVAAGTLPPVSFVKPNGALLGHPGTSKLDLFEEFVLNIVNQVKANPKLWADTAIFVSYDESGGLYDSGFIQPVDFFGDGPRMPLLVISPFSTGGRVSHSYGDQASVLKFIERNWNLGKISNRSRDNLPNPIMNPLHPWVPVNMPAIDDLFDMFDFTLGSIIQNDVNNIEDQIQQDISKIDSQIQQDIHP
jgi:phospholipase C